MGIAVVVIVLASLLTLVWLLLHYGKGTRFSFGARLWKVFEVDLKFGVDDPDSRADIVARRHRDEAVQAAEKPTSSEHDPDSPSS